MSTHYDLHSHSLASDGCLSPTELVRRARTGGVDVLALTDHDDTAGLGEAAVAAREHGLSLVPGVEISVTWEGLTVHIVGLNIDAGDRVLQQGLASLREFRQWRAEEMGRRLASRRVPDAYAGAAALAKGNIISRTHFARYLMDQGYARSMKDAFRHYLRRNRPGYVPGRWAELGQALAWIRGAGGEAVLAHPARYELSATKMRRLLGEFVEAGGVALEVVSGSHSPQDVTNMARQAAAFGLRASAGSDFHDPDNPWIELGRLPPLPPGCEPVWAQWERDGQLNRAVG